MRDVIKMRKSTKETQDYKLCFQKKKTQRDMTFLKAARGFGRASLANLTENRCEKASTASGSLSQPSYTGLQMQWDAEPQGARQNPIPRMTESPFKNGMEVLKCLH